MTYYRLKWYPGVVARLAALLKSDPQFTDRDAVYYYLADSLTELNRAAEAVPLLEKIPQEFEKSDYTEKATKLLADIKSGAVHLPAPRKPPKQAQPKQTAPKEAPQTQAPQTQPPPAPATPAQTAPNQIAPKPPKP